MGDVAQAVPADEGVQPQATPDESVSQVAEQSLVNQLEASLGDDPATQPAEGAEAGAAAPTEGDGAKEGEEGDDLDEFTLSIEADGAVVPETAEPDAEAAPGGITDEDAVKQLLPLLEAGKRNDAMSVILRTGRGRRMLDSMKLVRAAEDTLGAPLPDSPDKLAQAVTRGQAYDDLFARLQAGGDHAKYALDRFLFDPSGNPRPWTEGNLEYLQERFTKQPEPVDQSAIQQGWLSQRVDRLLVRADRFAKAGQEQNAKYWGAVASGLFELETGEPLPEAQAAVTGKYQGLQSLELPSDEGGAKPKRAKGPDGKFVAKEDPEKEQLRQQLAERDQQQRAASVRHAAATIDSDINRSVEEALAGGKRLLERGVVPQLAYDGAVTALGDSVAEAIARDPNVERIRATIQQAAAAGDQPRVDYQLGQVRKIISRVIRAERGKYIEQFRGMAGRYNDKQEETQQRAQQAGQKTAPGGAGAVASPDVSKQPLTGGREGNIDHMRSLLA